jgi:hypothetical protein
MATSKGKATKKADDKKSSNVAILRCDCKHSFQDRQYGPGMRVHNYCHSDKNKDTPWRCTVCGTNR